MIGERVGEGGGWAFGGTSGVEEGSGLEAKRASSSAPRIDMVVEKKEEDGWY
jgi:hypothetical protein